MIEPLPLTVDVEVTGTTLQYVYAFLVLYILLMAYLAYLGYRANRDQRDMKTFTLAKGYLGPVALGAAFAATWSSAVVFMGLPGIAYSSGLSAFWHSFPLWFLGVLVMILIAKTFRKMGATQGSLSVPEWIADRYDNYWLSIAFALLIVVNTIYVAAQFVGLAILFDTIIGMTYELGVSIALVVTIVYVAVGGTYTDVLSDFIQAILMALLGLAIIIVTFVVIGPFEIASQLAADSQNLVTPLNPEFPLFDTPVAVFGVLFFAIIFGFQPQVANKYLSLRSQKDIKLFIGSALVVHTMVYAMIWNGPLAYVLFEDIPAPDYATPAVLVEVFPAILVAFFGVAIISAAISTTDGLIVSIATSIGNDAYRKYHEENSEGPVSTKVERRSVWIARATIVAVGLVAAYIALAGVEFLLEIAILAVFAFNSAATPVIVGGMFWSRSSVRGAFGAVVVGPTIMALWEANIIFADVLSVYVAGTYATLIAATVFIVVSFLDPNSVPAPSTPESQLADD